MAYDSTSGPRDPSGLQNEAPGTILLAQMQSNLDQRRYGELVVHPRPSEDPNDPLNWSKPRKWINFSISAFYALMIFAILDIGGVAWQEYNTDLGISDDQLNDASASMLAGLAVRCLLFIPFALKFGRRPVYIFTTLVAFATAVWQAALYDYGSMVATQVLSGLAGAVSETIIQISWYVIALRIMLLHILFSVGSIDEQGKSPLRELKYAVAEARELLEKSEDYLHRTWGKFLLWPLVILGATMSGTANMDKIRTSLNSVLEISNSTTVLLIKQVLEEKIWKRREATNAPDSLLNYDDLRTILDNETISAASSLLNQELLS